MVEKTVLELPVLLPNGTECESCTRRLAERLTSAKGVKLVAPEATEGALVLHYDPDLITLTDIRKIAAREGVEIGERYHHEILDITGMDCPDCARTLEAGVGRLKGVGWVSVNATAATMTVEYDSALNGHSTIVRVIRQLGYGVAEKAVGQIRLKVTGMDCADCAVKIEKSLAGVPGLHDVRIDFVGGTLSAVAESPANALPVITSRVREAGYDIASEQVVTQKRDWLDTWRLRRREIVTVVSGAGVLLGATTGLLHFPEGISTAAYVVAILAGWIPAARAGVIAVRRSRSVEINFLMSVAVAGASLIGQWPEAATVIFLYSLGNLLESRTMDRARDSIRKLMALSPQEATLLRDGVQTRVQVGALHVGDTILVKPGEKIATDGRVVRGESLVDQSAVTGESMPLPKGQGDVVYGGCVSGEGALEVEVTRGADDNTLARVARLVQQAQGQRAPSQRFVDRFARYYTPAVVGLAVLLALVPPLIGLGSLIEWVSRALVLLVISCPCALVISTPVAIVSALSSAARNGVLVKGGAHLEAMGQLRAVAFDKTGTLTVGRTRVTLVVGLNGRSEEEVLRLASSIEGLSQHPLARAIVQEARHRGVLGEEAEAFRSVAGRGATATVGDTSYHLGSRELVSERVTIPEDVEQRLLERERLGESAVLLGTDGELIGLIGVADQLRPEATDSLKGLRESGIQHLVMLTGDNVATAAAIAGQAGLTEFKANLLPEDKVKAIGELVRQYGRVAMVGDGVNDAPALAAATVGIAMGAAGTDVALETADVALMSDDLSKLPYLVRLGRRTLDIIRQNVSFALALKLAFVALAVPGLATLWMAVFADVGASLIVILNGMRLLERRTGS